MSFRFQPTPVEEARLNEKARLPKPGRVHPTVNMLNGRPCPKLSRFEATTGNVKAGPGERIIPTPEPGVVKVVKVVGERMRKKASHVASHAITMPDTGECVHDTINRLDSLSRQGQATLSPRRVKTSVLYPNVRRMAR